MLNDYDILSLMDTHKELKKEGVEGIPASFSAFLKHTQPLNLPPETDGTLST